MTVKVVSFWFAIIAIHLSSFPFFTFLIFF